MRVLAIWQVAKCIRPGANVILICFVRVADDTPTIQNSTKMFDE